MLLDAPLPLQNSVDERAVAIIDKGEQIFVQIFVEAVREDVALIVVYEDLRDGKVCWHGKHNLEPQLLEDIACDELSLLRTGAKRERVRVVAANRLELVLDDERRHVRLGEARITGTIDG